MEVPAAVKEAIKRFQPQTEDDIHLEPPKPNETSVLFKWGVLVSTQVADGRQLGWICMGDEACRLSWEVIPLYNRKTSNATRHLKEAHGVSSDKTLAQLDRKRTLEEEVEELKGTLMFRRDPKRLKVLLSTRLIVYRIFHSATVNMTK